MLEHFGSRLNQHSTVLLKFETISNGDRILCSRVKNIINRISRENLLKRKNKICIAQGKNEPYKACAFEQRSSLYCRGQRFTRKDIHILHVISYTGHFLREKIFFLTIRDETRPHVAGATELFILVFSRVIHQVSLPPVVRLHRDPYQTASLQYLWRRRVELILVRVADPDHLINCEYAEKNT